MKDASLTGPFTGHRDPKCRRRGRHRVSPRPTCGQPVQSTRVRPAVMSCSGPFLTYHIHPGMLFDSRNSPWFWPARSPERHRHLTFPLLVVVALTISQRRMENRKPSSAAAVTHQAKRGYPYSHIKLGTQNAAAGISALASHRGHRDA